MRLVQFERRDGARGVGVLGEGGLIDLFEAGYASTLELVRAATDEGGLVAVVGAALARLGGSSRLPGPGPAAPYRLRAPIDPPEVWASAALARGGAAAGPEAASAAAAWHRSSSAPAHRGAAGPAAAGAPAAPAAVGRCRGASRSARPSGRVAVPFFLKGTARTCVGPDEAIVVRAGSRLTLAQPALAVVLDGAHRVVGYTLADDVVARDLEQQDPAFVGLARSYAGSCALGPALVSADDITDPLSLALAVRILRSGRLHAEWYARAAGPGPSPRTLVAALVSDNPVPAGTVLLVECSAPMADRPGAPAERSGAKSARPPAHSSRSRTGQPADPGPDRVEGRAARGRPAGGRAPGGPPAAGAAPGAAALSEVALEAGDVVEIEAEPLGLLRTPVRRGVAG